MFSLIRSFVFNLDPEIAHDLAIKSLKLNFLPSKFFEIEDESLLNINVLNKKFINPLGLAAGFDKSAEVYNTLFKLGFGFVEVGTVTPKKQYGNPKPRMFRLEKDKALINRLGFNNDGLEIIKSRISQNPPKGFLGINIGPNKNTKDQLEDFILCANSLRSLADYLTINISSPNTVNLRSFHDKENLFQLLTKMSEIKKKNKEEKTFLLKISPDIEENYISHIIELIEKFGIDGVILTNTSDKNRDSLVDPNKSQEGGISGQPIKDLSTKFIKKFYKNSKGKIPIIGVGGIDTGLAAFEKITAGASLIQLYTGMIYKGPGIVKKIKKDLIKILKSEKINKLSDAVGINN